MMCIRSAGHSIWAAMGYLIGDTTHDLQMALNAQVPSVAVSYGAHEPHTFAQFPTRFVAHSVAELQAWLGGG
jgi:phosphoglycolate phosphatase